MRRMFLPLALLTVAMGYQTASAQSSGLDHSPQDPQQAPALLLDDGIVVGGPGGGFGQEAAQAPGLIERDPVPAGSIVVLNRANSVISILYWDGDAWNQVKIASGASQTISCGACGATIDIAFHNGESQQEFTAAIGNYYEIYWNGRNWSFRSDP